MANLLLIESPGKIRKLSQILGPGWIVKASVGHVRELANDGEDSLGFDLGERTVDCRYVPRSPKAKQILTELRQAVKQADAVYIATDPDREGETIGWHLQQALRLKQPHRVVYREITPAAVRAAIANPRQLDQSLIAAGRARDCLDKLVGYKGSRHVVWPLQNGAKSMGRVQSATLHLLCLREREILAFIPEDYWSVWVHYSEGLKAFYRRRPQASEVAARKSDGKADSKSDGKPESKEPESDRINSQAEAYRLDGKKHAFGVQTLQQVFEALAFLADESFLRDLHVVEVQHVALDSLAAHFRDRLRLNALHVHVEQRQAHVGLGYLVLRRRARDQQDLVSALRARRPDLAAVDGVARVRPFGPRLEARRVEARVRLGDAEAHLLLAEMIFGRYSCFCSLVPNFSIGFAPKMLRWIDEQPVKPAPERATVCIMMEASIRPRPEPPTSSGMAMPSQPPSAIALVTLPATSRCRPSSRQYSASNSRQTAVTASRIASWSSVMGAMLCMSFFPVLPAAAWPRRFLVQALAERECDGEARLSNRRASKGRASGLTFASIAISATISAVAGANSTPLR
ncbi:MAG: type IA DNA topoisomerase [Synechococcales cyanobacterium RU_4_20]|nr:type IA DNA topoisomerase [Synechococcales cyanobacterium RU_4_20]